MQTHEETLPFVKILAGVFVAYTGYCRRLLALIGSCYRVVNSIRNGILSLNWSQEICWDNLGA